MTSRTVPRGEGRELDDGALRELLQQAALAHEPNRDVILSRMDSAIWSRAQGRPRRHRRSLPTAAQRPRWSGFRQLVPALAVAAAVLLIAGVVQRVVPLPTRGLVAQPAEPATVQMAAGVEVTVDGFASLAPATTGGSAGAQVTVSTRADLEKYARAPEPYTIRLAGVITLEGQIPVASDKTILGVTKGAGLTGGGLQLKAVSNVILANLTFRGAVGTDAVGLVGAKHVLITHCDFSSDLDHGADYYDGLVDITKGSDLVTVSWSVFHDHAKVMLIGGNDDDGGVDTGKLRVTVHHNIFRSVGSYTPSVRFGTVHVANNLFDQVTSSGIQSRMGAVVRVEGNVFTAVKNPVLSHGASRQDGNLDVAAGNLEQGRVTTATAAGGSPARTWAARDYRFTADPAETVEARLTAQAGPH